MPTPDTSASEVDFPATSIVFLTLANQDGSTDKFTYSKEKRPKNDVYPHLNQVRLVR